MLNPQQLEDKLLELPNKIREQQKKVITERERFDMAKMEYDVMFAHALLTANSPNATEKKQKAIVATQEAKRNLIHQQAIYEGENAELEARQNQFISLRKVAQIETDLIRVNLTGN